MAFEMTQIRYHIETDSLPPKKAQKKTQNLGGLLPGWRWVDVERRLPQVGRVRPAARRPVPPGESRTIVTSIGVVGHSGEVVS